MVVVIKKVKRDRVDMVFIPKSVIQNYLEKHVDRRGLQSGNPNTCLVNHWSSWTGRPSHRAAVNLLLEVVKQEEVLEEGEFRYPIPKHFFGKIVCRNFDVEGDPVAPPGKGDFQIRYIRVNGETKPVMKLLKDYKESEWERKKVAGAFAKVEKTDGAKKKKFFVFVMHHVMPVMASP